MATDRGGYDYSFVNTPPDELICKLCCHPSREPYLSTCCGHTFCKTCLEDAKRANQTSASDVRGRQMPPLIAGHFLPASINDITSTCNAVIKILITCPMCRSENFSSFPNKQNERAVKSLKVFCTNRDKGCVWEGEINSIAGHIDICEFEEVKCSNECGLSIQRQHLSKHIDTRCPCSEITCQYCNTIGERQFINGQHTAEYLKLPFPCPNKCGIETTREKVEMHREVCTLEMIQCEYYVIGCKQGITRQNKTNHNKEKMEHHLALIKSKYLLTKNKLENAENRIKELENSVTSTKIKLADTETKLEVAENKIGELENAMERRLQVVENMISSYKLQWHNNIESKVRSQCTELPVFLKMSEYLRKKGSGTDWYSESFSWRLSVFDRYPEMKLRIIPAGNANGKGTHLSIHLYLVKGGYKRDFAELERKLTDQLQKITEAQEAQRHKFHRTLLPDRSTTKFEEKEQQRQRLVKEIEQLKAKQASWQKLSLAHIQVTILNQISDNEHYSKKIKLADLNIKHLLTNKVCNELILDIPCFVSNEVLYKSTSTCRFLKDDNIYVYLSI